MARILVVAPCGFPTTQGSQVYIRGSARALAAAGHDVRVLTYDYGEPGVDSGVRVERVRGVWGYRKLRAGGSPAKLLLDGRMARSCRRRLADVDVVHAHNAEGPWIAAALQRAVPVVHHVHTLFSEELPSYYPQSPRTARRLGALVDRLTPRLADAAVVLSRRAGVAVPGAWWIPPAIEPSEFPRAANTAGETVVYAGNPDRYQEPKTLLHGFARLARQRPNARLRLVSAASMADWVRAGVAAGIPKERLEVVEACSWEVTRAAVRSAAVAAVPRSLCAGFPIKLLNFMALGLPTVVCRGAAGPIRDGSTGRVVADADPAAFAAALEALLDRPEERRRLGTSARAEVFRNHTWANRASTYAALHASLGVDAPSGALPASRSGTRVQQ